jgi:hypothetical protein
MNFNVFHAIVFAGNVVLIKKKAKILGLKSCNKQTNQIIISWQNILDFTSYVILKTVTFNGGKTNAAEKSLPFQGSASILIGLSLVTPPPP